MSKAICALVVGRVCVIFSAYFGRNIILQNTLHSSRAPKMGTVDHACNPSYSGSRDWDDGFLRLALTEKFLKPHLDQ
jgi:hypothetical protein